MKVKEINNCFIDYYRSLGYEELPRASLLDDSIPMSFVMSAGLVQIEKSIAKMQVRNKDKYVIVQDCFRHFDLERVGTDDIHLSIFKMPGAFKFSPNGKVDLVVRMWELVTSVLGLNKDNLWVSYFAGGQVEGSEFQEDKTVYQVWKQLGIPEQHIVGLGPGDNFWLQGRGFDGGDGVRKSGPNTEIFYDRGVNRACGQYCKPGCKCGRFIEFSNSLFISYKMDFASKTFQLLDEPFSETVIGTERVAMILQNKESVFEIDSYQPVLKMIRSYFDQEKANPEMARIGERVLADHLRALVQLIADDAPPPGKNGRQRLIKKLFRGIMTSIIVLEITNPDFLFLVLDKTMDAMEIESVTARQIRDRFSLYYSMQEQPFLTTIQKGKRELDRLLRANGKLTLSSENIVILEKEWGLPRLFIAKDLLARGFESP
jgi:alanyl-tRNA synthetase